MADADVRSEDLLGVKWDRCMSDTLMKFGTGLIIGGVFSVALFKRRPWPVTLGAGFGLGMGYANCQNDFRNPYLIHGKRVKEASSSRSPYCLSGHKMYYLHYTGEGL